MFEQHCEFKRFKSKFGYVLTAKLATSFGTILEKLAIFLDRISGI